MCTRVQDGTASLYYCKDGVRLNICRQQQICRWQIKSLPFIRYEFCRRPARHLQSANFYFADGKQKICNRQVRRWPSAKFMSDKRQNKILPSANVKKVGQHVYMPARTRSSTQGLTAKQAPQRHTANTPSAGFFLHFVCYTDYKHTMHTSIKPSLFGGLYDVKP